jgi:hypothetical protein
VNWDYVPDTYTLRNDAVSIHLTLIGATWTLRIYKRQTAFGIPCTYEVAWADHFSPTHEAAKLMAEDILRVEVPELVNGAV